MSKFKTTGVLFVHAVIVFTVISSCSNDHPGRIESAQANELIAIKSVKETVSIEEEELSLEIKELLRMHPSSSDKLRVFSLRRFCDSLLKESTPVTNSVSLKGLGWVEGYVIDRENNDLLLFGREAESWPELKSDDLRLTIDKVRKGSQDPFCSLDPINGNVVAFEKAKERIPSRADSEELEAYLNYLIEVWGPQQVVVGGVPDSSHHAYTMLEADYTMKKMSLGLQTITPISSTLETVSEDNSEGSDASYQSSSRFWFVCREGHPEVLYEEDITTIDKLDVIIQTHAQGLNRQGELVDVEKVYPVSETWARRFSEYFPATAVQVKEFAELENLYRLLALFKAMKYQGHMDDVREVLDLFYHTCTYVRVYSIPETYKGLGNWSFERNERRIYHQISTGGVHMNPKVISNQVEKRESLSKTRQNIKESIPQNAISNWDVSESKPPEAVNDPISRNAPRLPQQESLPRK